MHQAHDFIAFPLMALAALVAIAVAIVGGELIRNAIVRGILFRLGLAHADLDGKVERKGPLVTPGSSGRAAGSPASPPGPPA